MHSLVCVVIRVVSAVSVVSVAVRVDSVDREDSVVAAIRVVSIADQLLVVCLNRSLKSPNTNPGTTTFLSENTEHTK